LEEDICLEEEEDDWKEEDCFVEDCIDEDCKDEDCTEEDCFEADFKEETWLNPLDSSLKDSIFWSWLAFEKLSDPPDPLFSDLNSPEVLFLIAASSPMGMTLMPPMRSLPRIEALFGSGCSILDFL